MGSGDCPLPILQLYWARAQSQGLWCQLPHPQGDGAWNSQVKGYLFRRVSVEVQDKAKGDAIWNAGFLLVSLPLRGYLWHPGPHQVRLYPQSWDY